MAQPKIRIKGFDGEWEEVLLSTIATFSKGRGYSKADICEKGTPIVLYGRMYTNYSTEIDNVDTYAVLKDNSVISKGNEIIIPASGETPEDIACASVVKQKGVIIGGDLNILSVDGSSYDPSLTALSITYGDAHRELSKSAQGKTVVHLHNSEISKTKLQYPSSIDEQKQIVSYFKSLDALIQTTTEKIASLKQLKSASLISMFPQNGEKTPRVRFKGFEGEWKYYSFGKLYRHNVIKNDLTFGTDKVISVANMHYTSNTNISDENYLRTYNIFRIGDIAFEGNKSKDFAHGRFVENTIGDGIVSHVFEVFTPISDEYDLNYWKYAINNERIMGKILLRCTKASTMMTNLTANEFLRENILVPSYEEQKEIGQFFASLDSQISIQEQRLEKLKQIKTACLEKMFV